MKGRAAGPKEQVISYLCWRVQTQGKNQGGSLRSNPKKLNMDCEHQYEVWYETHGTFQISESLSSSPLYSGDSEIHSPGFWHC
jgi:hypothetical protein